MKKEIHSAHNEFIAFTITSNISIVMEKKLNLSILNYFRS
jgi:hypothetical protein